MMDIEYHATRSDDWLMYGCNLGEEVAHMGDQFTDARRLMLAAWDGWTSGEPEPDLIKYEFLATLWAMVEMAEFDIKAAVVELINRCSEEVGDE